MPAVVFPGRLWFAVDRNTVTIDAAGKVVLGDNYEVMAISDGRSSGIVAFTQQYLMANYLKARADHDLVPVSPPTAELLMAFLEEQEANGVTHVVFDPVAAPRFAPIRAVIDALRQGPTV